MTAPKPSAAFGAWRKKPVWVAGIRLVPELAHEYESNQARLRMTSEKTHDNKENHDDEHDAD